MHDATLVRMERTDLLREAGVARLLMPLAGRDAQGVVEHLLAQALPDAAPARDDIALLALRAR